ncbi:MAG: Uma2 family endonuclease [Minicystis sp.]
MSTRTAAGPQSTPPATESDLLALPDEGRGWELLDGQLVEKQAGARHSRSQSRLNQVVLPYDRAGGGGQRPGGWVFLTEQLVRFGSQTLRPDVAGWRRERYVEPPVGQDAVLGVRPDWICEILSDGNATNDTIKKKRIYHRHEVPHYWLLDPTHESLTVLRWTATGYLEVLNALRGERVRAEPFDLVEFAVGSLFGEDEGEEPGE